MDQPEVEASDFTGTANEWDAFVREHPAASAAHLFAWKTVVESVYQHACPYLATYDGLALTGVLPLVDVRSLAFGRFLVSMPFLNAGGPLGRPADIFALSQAALEAARTRRAQVLELRCTSALDLEMDVSAEKVGSVLPLPDTTEKLWAAFPPKLRSQIRRPGKSGVEMRFGPDQLQPFFTVFARNMRDLGSPTHPFRFFRAVLDELAEHVWFGCAYYRGKPIAAGCALHWRDEVEMTWASSLREHSQLAPNMLLYCSFMERAITAGSARFSFGRCTPNTGSHRFKLQWGAADTPLFWYRAPLRPGADQPRQDRGALSLATRLWQHVPVPLATMVGARLRGGIPA